MILTDYFRCERSLQWDYAIQCGVSHATVRLPEHKDFDVTNRTHWRQVHDQFMNAGIKPIIIEPMPNELHDHIKIGDQKRDEAIDKVIRMLAIMDELDVRTICFNFMAHVGWIRTAYDIPERGGAYVTGFRLADMKPTDFVITEKELWDNYFYFIQAVLPYAEKYGIRLALHPDDPPISPVGKVERIMTSYENIRKAITMVPSSMLGVTMCQATYCMMGEDLEKIIPELGEKIFFVHFRNVRGKKEDFMETFHDNGMIDMAKMVRLYQAACPNVPVRVDHVPTMPGEDPKMPGYGDIGRLFALGYLKGLMQQ